MPWRSSRTASSGANSDTPEKVTQVALESLSLMKVSMEASYHA